MDLRAEVPAVSVSYVIPSQRSCWVSSYNISGFPNPFYPLGILGPFHSLGNLGLFHSFLLLTCPWALAKSFGLSRPNYYILYLWVYWPSNQSRLPIPFFGASLGLFAFFGATLLLYRHVDHYFCHLGPMVFTLLFLFIFRPFKTSCLT